MNSVTILGAGVTGLAAAKVFKDHAIDYSVIERENEIGGLCRSFSIMGGWCDYGWHAAFSDDPFIHDVYENGVEVYASPTVPLNYKKGLWLSHPVQNNLFPLGTEEKIRIIEDFVNRPQMDAPENYMDWLRSNLGEAFAKEYPAVYTRKYWTVEPEEMETKWIGIRFYKPRLDEVLRGAFDKKTPYVHYSGMKRYPRKGGYGAFLKGFRSTMEVECETEIVRIDPIEKYLFTKDGRKLSYESLLSTIPLPELVRLIDNVPKEILNVAQKLNYTSCVLVSMIGTEGGTDRTEGDGYFFYDEDILMSRAYSPSQMAGQTEGVKTFQAEVFFSRFKPLEEPAETIAEKVIDQCVNLGLVKRSDLLGYDVRVIPYANIIFTHDIYDNRKVLLDYLDDLDIKCAGRYGSWEYLWSHQSMLSGRDAALGMIGLQK